VAPHIGDPCGMTHSMDSSADKSRRSIALIDAPGFVFRAFHALPPLSTADGQPTGAAYGFCNMLFRLIEELQPDYLAAVFDVGRSFRKDLFDQYKANRPPQPPELKSQFPLVRKLLGAFRVPVVELEGFEADDLIATLTRQARADDIDVVIVSSDKDLMQLASDHVQLLDTMKNKRFGPAEVTAKYGVSPDQLGDWLALVGDSSDNVPGIPGVGAKTATKLLQQYGSLEAVLAAAEEVSGKKLRQNLLDHAEQARLSRRLVELKHDCPVGLALGDLRHLEPDDERLRGLFEQLEFGRLRDRLQPSTSLNREVYRTVTSVEGAREIADQVAKSPRVALAVATADGSARAPLIGLGLCWGESQACYVPVGHAYLGAPRQLTLKQLGDAGLLQLLEDARVPKTCHDSKAACVALRRAGVSLDGVDDDPMLASYVLDPSRSHQLADLALDHLGHQMLESRAHGARHDAVTELSLEQATPLFAERAEAALRLGGVLGESLAEEHALRSLMRDVELPLSAILAQMEVHGCLVDVDALRQLSRKLGRQLDALEQRIQNEAGWPVNVGSPKQLQKLLFEQLGLTTGRKTKTGYSTDAEVLADLALEHPVAGWINEHRILAKLKSTYLDALPALVDRETGRLHTSYNQAVAATGRLSSSDPNLQNIPIRTDVGRQIRAAFVAPEGKVLLSADYSQIELRVLAHLSKDPVLVDAFQQGQDVHSRTAAEVFGVPAASVDAEQRRIAKAVNFGVIYGQTDFGLSRQLHIPRADARRYIEGYFERYAGVKRFMEQLIADARETGSVQTLLGRRRQVHEISARRHQARSAAERIARNTPIQGTAADLIKIAMIRVERELAQHGWQAPMILTVHDELVLEVDEDAVEQVGDVVREAMTSVMKLEVPLVVDVRSGRSWAEAH
jgi:DNA polymerase-1